MPRQIIALSIYLENAVLFEDISYDSKTPLFKFGAGLSYSTGR